MDEHDWIVFAHDEEPVPPLPDGLYQADVRRLGDAEDEEPLRVRPRRRVIWTVEGSTAKPPGKILRVRRIGE